LTKDFFLYNKSTARSANFVNARECTGRFSLPPGEYMIVPSTFKPNEEGDFILRILTEQQNTNCTKELDEETKRTDVKPAPEDPNLDAKLKPFFEKLAGKDGEIDAFELQMALNPLLGNDDGFSIEACRSMLAVADVTMSGKLDYDEFKTLFVGVQHLKKTFNKFDKNQNGSFDTSELREALKMAGYSLSNQMYTMLCIRYADKNSTVSIYDFVLMAVKLEHMFASFKEFKDMSQWLITTMYS